VRVGGGLELVDDEIRAVPASNAGYEIDLTTFIVGGDEASDGQPKVIPDGFQDRMILSVNWGFFVLTKVSLLTLPNCPICWAEGLNTEGKRTLVFSRLNDRNPDKRGWSVAVVFGRVKKKEE
jgi:hypothetical protein